MSPLPPLPVSPLGFGCASVMGKVDRGTAWRAMQIALDHGITHFDIARSYGFGRAESVLGDFLREHRNKTTITTKFGVVPPELSLKQRVLMPAARTALRIFPSLSQRVKRQSGDLLSARRFDVAYARTCLDQSLQKLKTEHIDIYLLHEPPAFDSDQLQKLKEFMLQARKSGKILRWGIACRAPQDLSWADHIEADVIQIEGNIQTAKLIPATQKTPHRLVTRPFCGGLQPDLFGLVERILPGTHAQLKQSGHDLADLALAVSRRLGGPQGSIIAAMYTPAHIISNAHRIGRINSSAALLATADEFITKSALAV